MKDSEPRDNVLISSTRLIMKLQSIALSVTCICFAGIGYSALLMIPQKATAQSIYADHHLHVLIKTDSQGINYELRLNQ